MRKGSIIQLYLIVFSFNLIFLSNGFLNSNSLPIANGVTEPPNILWNRTYGVPVDSAYSIFSAQLTDGGFVLAGEISLDNPDPSQYHQSGLLVRTDSDGTFLWNKTYGSSINAFSFTEDLISTSDGGMLLLYRRYSYTSINGQWLVKMNKDGVVLWNQTFEDLFEIISFSTESIDGGYAVSGLVNNSRIILKLSQEGNREWFYTYSKSESCGANDMIATSDGGYAIVGSVYNQSKELDSATDIWDYDLCLLKINKSGNIEWRVTYGGDQHDSGDAIIETSEGGFAISGTTTVNATEEDRGWASWLFITDADGNILLNKAIRTPSLYGLSSGLSLLQTQNGFLIIDVSAIEGSRLINSDEVGIINWEMDILSYPSASLIHTNDDRIVVAGAIKLIDENGDDTGLLTMWLMKLDYPISTSGIDVSTKRSLDLLFITLFLGGSFVTISSYYAYPRLKAKSVIKLSDPRNGKAVDFIRETFRNQTSLYFVLLGQDIIDDKVTQEEIENKIPKRIFEYKFLFNPVRLSMTKLLFENLEMTSVELKEIMEISWNDYSTHIRALENKGYIRISENFSDGKRNQRISLEPLGINKYTELIDLLQLFLDNTSEYREYLESLSGKDGVDDPLYPK